MPTARAASMPASGPQIRIFAMTVFPAMRWMAAWISGESAAAHTALKIRARKSPTK